MIKLRFKSNYTKSHLRASITSKLFSALGSIGEEEVRDKTGMRDERERGNSSKRKREGRS
jgi:hypothetical protein